MCVSMHLDTQVCMRLCVHVLYSCVECVNVRVCVGLGTCMYACVCVCMYYIHVSVQMCECECGSGHTSVYACVSIVFI